MLVSDKNQARTERCVTNNKVSSFLISPHILQPSVYVDRVLIVFGNFGSRHFILPAKSDPVKLIILYYTLITFSSFLSFLFFVCLFWHWDNTSCYTQFKLPCRFLTISPAAVLRNDFWGNIVSLSLYWSVWSRMQYAWLSQVHGQSVHRVFNMRHCICIIISLVITCAVWIIELPW